jgi:hypothetical protein
MPKKSIEENTNNEYEENMDNKIEEPVFENKVEEPVFENKVEEPIKEPTKNKLALDSVQFTIRRVDWAGLYVVDSKGNGSDIPIPREYKNKVLKAGDIILVSKSEL